MRNKLALIPNLITFGNLLLGFLSIVFIAQGRFFAACWLIIISSILDGFDGALSRWLQTGSRFGVELDSLTDIVSFGISPALLLYFIVFKPFGAIGFILAYGYLFAGMLRLAHFNVNYKKPAGKIGFSGLPITSAALFISSLYLFLAKLNVQNGRGIIYTTLALLLILLMLSKIPYRRMPVIPVRSSRYPALSVIILSMLSLVLIWDPPLFLFPFMSIYLLSGPLEALFKILKKLQIAHGEQSSNETFSFRKN